MRFEMPNALFTALALFAFACTGHADRVAKPRAESRPAPAVPVAAPAPRPAVPKPEERARAILEAQLKALPRDDAALLRTFAKGAVVVLPSFIVQADDPHVNLAAQVARMSPHTEMKSAKLGRLVAGGNDAMVWFAAELEVVVWSGEPGEAPSEDTHAMRIVELADAGSGWKVIAGSFTKITPLRPLREPNRAISSATEPGPLVPLLASPEDLRDSLASDPVIVLGTEASERAVGQKEAKALLTRWSKLPLEIEAVSKVREVHTAAWGYAMAHVNLVKPGGSPYRMLAFLIAVPAPGGSWKVVAVSYGAL